MNQDQPARPWGRLFLRAVLRTLVMLVVIAAVLYFFFGLRVVLDGGGTPHLRFVTSAESQAEAIAADRTAQHAERAAPTAPEQDAQPAVAGDAPETTADRPVATSYWTDFRGPLRDGYYQQQPIRTDWPAGGLKPLWKEPVGGGYASFVAAQGRIFTIEQRRGDETVAAYDLRTGRELWTNAWPAEFQEFMGGNGPRATPTWHDGTLYALGALGELRAIDAGNGRTAWRTNILEDNGASNLQWGMSAAPLIVDETVITLPGGSNGRSVAAYDRRTGKKVWTALSDQQGYSSPMLVTIGGVRQILVFSASRLMGITPERGDLLWEYPWTTDYGVNASQPVRIGDNRLFVSTGYGTGAGVIEVTSAGGKFAVREVWRNNRMKNQFTTSLVHDGYIYGLDESILACLDANTGELKWKGGRYGYGQVMLASGHLIVLTEDGALALVRATPARHEEIARFPVLDGKTWNHPIIADGILVVRSLAEMAAFDLRVP